MKNKVTSLFADRLQDLIAESGKTISELSSPEEIGISTGSLSKYQNDAAEPGITALVKIADYFGVSYDYLLGKSDSKQRENIDINKRLGLSDKAIKVLENVINNKKNEKTFEVTPIEVFNYILESDIFTSFLWRFCICLIYNKKYEDDGGHKSLLFPGDPEYHQLEELQLNAPKGYILVSLSELQRGKLHEARDFFNIIMHELESKYYHTQK